MKQQKLNKKQLSVIKEQVVSGTGTDFNTVSVSQPEDEETQARCEIENWDGLKHEAYRPQQTEEARITRNLNRDSFALAKRSRPQSSVGQAKQLRNSSSLTNYNPLNQSQSIVMQDSEQSLHNQLQALI